MTYEKAVSLTGERIERRKEIAQEIYHQIKTSLHRHIEVHGTESEHSIIRELRHEKELAARALVELGVKVA
jgi:hypothetical protein